MIQKFYYLKLVSYLLDRCTNIERNRFTWFIKKLSLLDVPIGLKYPILRLPVFLFYRIGGLGQKVLGDGVEIIEFPDMKHGWTVKGDRSEPEVERDVMKAFNFAITFFGKYLHWSIGPKTSKKPIWINLTAALIARKRPRNYWTTFLHLNLWVRKNSLSSY